VDDPLMKMRDMPVSPMRGSRNANPGCVLITAMGRLRFAP
jgi:hypothetical protein